jgi:hypothetical protein
MTAVTEDTDPELATDPRVEAAERRRALRLAVILPTRIDTKTRPQRFAMTRNVSRTGALLATPSRFRIGERAILRFRAPDASDYTRVEAQIVRLELNPDNPIGFWPYLAAVRFETPLPPHGALLLDEPTEL